jgi:hypothetical protein
MSDIRYRPEAGNSEDPALTRLLREHYAAPVDSDYWSGFEAAIMKRVSRGDSAPAGIFELLAGWSRPGLIAAGVAGLIAGLAISRVRQAEASVAYEAVFRDSSPAVAMQIPPEQTKSAREATLRYLITP